SGNKKWFLIAVVVISAAKAWGQAAPSPFTTYGIGEAYGNGLVHNQGTGLGISQPQYWYINNQNPAMLVFNTFSVFQIGLVGESRQVKSDIANEKNVGGNLNYIVMAFPIKITKWTSSLGLMPYTNVDFSFQYFDYARDPQGTVVDTLITKETGAGGLTQVYWSNGVRLSKDMSVGLKISYLFGPVSNVYSNVLTPGANDDAPYIVNIEDKTNTHGFNFALGYSLSKDSLGRRQNRRLSVGALYNFASDLTSLRDTRIFRSSLAGDTIERYKINDVSGKVHLPQSITVGISYGKNMNWSVGTEFFYQDWANFKSVNSDDEGLGKSWRASLGGEFTRDPFALENYLKRITFRAGASFEQYPFYANGVQVKDYGINLGFSLPAGRSSMDFAVKLGKRGNKDQNILEENYFKIFLGLTFNDQWFIRRKFD
ncbi:MAG TPA: hypothetical protein VK666_30705, partial [Chryseolinea sp.]|nr:hypothetical protein [Chryseolinea sp.]